jgi:leucyl aminopeptidase
MKLNLSKKPIHTVAADLLIILTQGENPLLSEELSHLRPLLKKCMKKKAFAGKRGETKLMQIEELNVSSILLAGCGTKKLEPFTVERAISSAIRFGISEGCRSFILLDHIPSYDWDPSLYHTLSGRAAIWGSYTFTAGKSTCSTIKGLKTTFTGDRSHRALINRAQIQGDALLKTANLANLPGNLATPKTIATYAKELADSCSLSCKIMGENQLRKNGFGGVLAVSAGSETEPQLIQLEHNIKNRSQRPLVLVGKTVTFDSGGISLKPGKNMDWMRYDKSGGMAVLAAMHMISEWELNIPVIGILGAAENMPGGAATRPGDIIHMYNGKTVEVLNTDAEGRLILADAISYAAAQYNPRAIVDVATLTGAVIVTLGHAASAVLGNDQSLVEALLTAGHQSGERLWQLPLFDEYAEDMQSQFADLSNLSKSGSAGTATAAAFLNEFVPKQTAWAHLDIAGTAWEMSSTSHQAAGATLFGARLLTQWVETCANNDNALA